MAKNFVDKPFKDQFDPLFNDARQHLLILNQKLKETKQRFQETVSFFVPNAPKYVREMNSKRFLGIFVDFIEALDQEQQRMKQRFADRGKFVLLSSSLLFSLSCLSEI